MGIEFLVRPNDQPMTWDEFCRTTQPFSIALDGYVAEGPIIDIANKRANFNHHEGVVRIPTRATCLQVALYIRIGLFERHFRDQYGPKAYVYMNDCDHDVCLSRFAIKYSYLIKNPVNPCFNKVLGMVDILDTMAGAFPFDKDMPLLQELAWIFEPYTTFRLNGGVDRKNAWEFELILTLVEERIMAYILGDGEKLPLDTRFEVYKQYPTWAITQEIGAQAKIGMMSSGIVAGFYFRDRGNGRWTHTIWRMSDLEDFPVPGFIKHISRLDDAEWGGGDTVGGSNRVLGSKFSPDQLDEIARDYLRK